MSIFKIFYGLKSPDELWDQKLFEKLRDMRFRPCCFKFYLWMSYCGDHYEYVAVMVDDLLIFIKYNELIIETLNNIWKYEPKGEKYPDYYRSIYVDSDKGQKFHTLSELST